MKKSTMRKIMTTIQILTPIIGFASFMLLSNEADGYCLDRPGPTRPNTGYCTYQGGYQCLPGGVTCDGQS